ncbi:MAG TPA: Fic/DOC family N-terminal domain-containing protein [Bacteroidales bacterium]|nr:Fic/DOC family N-terminal domain-containing protein [Bacteroidales bacterium]HPS17751.1 Fic/DOC family N-terminal domain-containing protein [Bacteroidales bacterium]
MGHKAPYHILDKLPPKREKVETLKILRQVNKTAAALAELKGFTKTIPNQAMLINAIVIQEAKGSSEIENIITTQDELYKALTINKTNISPQTKEVVNYRKAIIHGFKIVTKQGFLKVNDIISIQQELVNNTAGIRSLPGTVLKNDKTGEVVYTPPQDKNEILDLLSNFITHYNQNDSDLNPLINLAILHYQFESIHPFYDGNGRTGRILNILYLILNHLIDIPILYLSSYIIQNKTKYYKLLNLVNKTGEWEEWILFMLRAIETTSLQTIEKIYLIRQLLEKTIQKAQLKAPKIYKKELIELLFEQPYSKIEFVVNYLNVERKAASRYLKELEQIGIIKSQKVGRETIYINHKIIEILKG